MDRRPNIVFVFSDQHRAEAVGYAGNKDVLTPCMDKLCGESLSFTTAVSGAPVSSPYRGSLLTGQYPLTHGVFVNDVSLGTQSPTIAEVLSKADYDTAYIGKWHIDGRGRSAFIPKERRFGFEYWKVLECTHSYNKSNYYGDTPEKLQWEGYDAFCQTEDAREYIKSRKKDKPFALFLSWGPPHNPYATAPEEFRKLYDPEKLSLRPNVPEEFKEQARKDLAGYYSHVTALDKLLGDLYETIRGEGLEEDTIFIYTSDHGDMLFSHGLERKQKPWDESILVPFILHYPRLPKNKGEKMSLPFNAPDIMPTLLGLCNIEIPETVEGKNFAPYLKGEEKLEIEAALIACYHPFGEFSRNKGGKEYRGIRTERYTYVRDLKGSWLLYDNIADPYQLNNLCGSDEYRVQQSELDSILAKILKERGDEFLRGEEYLDKWGYIVDETGTVPYTK